MAWINKNFSYSTLNGGVLIGASSMTLNNGTVFPATGDFMCVIWDQSYANPSFDPTAELVKCTARSTHVLTITRAQEGTSAKAWNSGDKVAHVYTAALYDAVVTLDGVQTLTNKTLTTPTIASFTNATHGHTTTATGGTLAASAIASGSLVHERGGLEADVSAYNGLVKISGGATSAVTAPTSTIVGISDSQTLSNKVISCESWTNVSSFGSGWTGYDVSYMKDPMGFVHLKGYLTCTAGAYSQLFTLPSGYRPTQEVLHIGFGDGAHAGFLTINTSGVVIVGIGGIAGYYALLDGLTFRAA